MASIFERLWKAGSAAFIARAILVALLADALLLGFILGRRAYRKRYFAKRDSRVFEFRQKWEKLIAGEIPYQTWRRKPFDRRIIESMALDMFEVAGPEESARLLKFLRASGLIEKRIFEARELTGWRRMRALVALGRTRAPEGIPALAEGLRDGHIETRLASLRGLGRTASPQAGQEILAWVGEKGLVVPALPLQSALIQCCAERPQILLPYLQHAAGAVREVLGRVLGEIATPSLSMELLQFVGDDLDELRAAAARALSNGQPSVAFDVLDDLSQDRAWFVRLRAIVSAGKLSGPRAIPTLLRGLTDSHRLVRLRAAEALVGFTTDPIAIFDQVVGTGDRYGLHAYLTALENADLRTRLEQELSVSLAINEERKAHLQEVLLSGALKGPESLRLERVSASLSS